MIDVYSQLSGKSIRIGGRNPTLRTTTSYSLISPIADTATSTFTTPDVVFASGGVQTATLIQVSSSSASDAPTGTNAQKVRVAGLDATWKLQYEDIVIPAGAGTLKGDSTKTFMRVFGAQVIQHGVNPTNAGSIYICKSGTAVTAGVPAITSLMAKILPTSNATTNGYFTVPAGTSYKLGDLYATARTQPATIVIAGMDPLSTNKAYFPIGTIELTTASSAVIFNNLDSTIFTEKTDILLMAMGTALAVVSVQLGLTQLVI